MKNNTNDTVALKEALQISRAENARNMKVVAEQAAALQTESEARIAAEEALKVLSSPPLGYGTVLRTLGDNLVVLSQGGKKQLVSYSPGVAAADLTSGREVLVSLKTGNVIGLAPVDVTAGVEMTFSEWLESSSKTVALLSYGTTGQKTTARLSASIDSSTLKPNSRVIVSDGIIVEIIPELRSGNFFGDAEKYLVPHTSLPPATTDDISGHEGIVKELVEAVQNPYKVPHLYEAYRKTQTFKSLLYGPPGNGKSTLIRIIASLLWKQYGEKILPHASGNLILVNGSELSQKFVGELERLLGQIFKGCSQLYKITGAPMLIVFDDLEAWLRVRGSGLTDYKDDYVTTACTMIDGVLPMEGICILGATNRADLVDPAILDRFKVKRYVKPITERAVAEGVVNIHLRGAVIASGHDPTRALMDYLFDSANEKNIIQVTFEGGDEEVFPLHRFLSGRLLENIVERTKDILISLDAESGGDTVTGIREEDILRAVCAEFEDSSYLPNTIQTVTEWMRQRDDKRIPLKVTTLHNPQSLAILEGREEDLRASVD